MLRNDNETDGPLVLTDECMVHTRGNVEGLLSGNKRGQVPVPTGVNRDVDL